MKTKHNIPLGGTITFNNLQELHNWAEKHHYKDDEFACINLSPFTLKKQH